MSQAALTIIALVGTAVAIGAGAAVFFYLKSNGHRKH